jgi:nuclear transport factor 2 (NTF2) superfamily protein
MKIMVIKPPFTKESALQKVQNAQDAWNTQDPEKVIQGYSVDSQWRNRSAFFKGKGAILKFLKRKWEKELDYHLKKELWAFTENRIAVRFEYEWRDADTGQWYRTHGNEHWEFNNDGLMHLRDMSANDVPILESERKIDKN